MCSFFLKKLSVFRRNWNESISSIFYKKSGKIFSIFLISQKLYKSVWNSNYECKQLNVLFVFSAVFFALLGSPGSKNTNIFRSLFCWKVSFSDPHIERMRKTAKSIKHSKSCNSVSSTDRRFNSFILLLAQGYSIEKILVLFLASKSWYNGNEKKTAITFEKSRSSNFFTP